MVGSGTLYGMQHTAQKSTWVIGFFIYKTILDGASQRGTHKANEWLEQVDRYYHGVLWKCPGMETCLVSDHTSGQCMRAEASWLPLTFSPLLLEARQVNCS